MHNDHTSLYFDALKDTIRQHWLPSTRSGMPRQMAMCSHRILAQLAINIDSIPRIQQQALASYRSCLDGADLSELVDLGAVDNYADVEAGLQAWIATQGQSLNDMDAERVSLLRAIVDIEADSKQAALSALTSALSSNEESEETDLISSRQQNSLQQYLRSVFSCESLKIIDITAIPGGYSKHTLFIKTTNAPDVPEVLVVRLDREDSPRGSKVVDEYQVIKTLYDNGVAVPKIFSLEETGNVLDGAFLLMSKIPGASVGDALDVETGSRELALDLAAKLARVHQVPAEHFGDGLPGASVTTVERMQAEIVFFEEQWRQFDFPSLSLEYAFAWLKANIELADGPRSLVHKDLGFHNMLVDDNAVTGFLDWESACIGNPAEDLGYLKKAIDQMCDWDEFLAAYGVAGGVIPNAEQQAYYELWGLTWLTVMIMIAGNVFTSGASKDTQLAYVGTYMKTRLEAQLASAVKALQ